MPKSIAQDEVDRLSKFILRSKVEIEILPEPITYFCSDDAKAIDRPCPALPREPMQAYVGDSVIVVRLPSMTHKACTANSWLSARSLMTCTLRSKHTTAWLAL